MKQINVIKENCIGCGACVAIDKAHFEFDKDGKSNVISNENLESENLLNAMESCPTSAIELIEVNTENQENKSNEEVCESCEEEACECTECDCDECKHHQNENDTEK